MTPGLFDHLEPKPSPPAGVTAASLCVLGSSSSGNCSAIVLPAGILLIDCGFSRRRTRTLLDAAGLADAPILAVVLTHLDTDHANPSFLASLPDDTPVFMHARHLGRAEREGLLHHRTEPFRDDFSPAPGVHVRSILVAHDSLGAAAFRVHFDDGRGDLGYATDLGRPTAELADHLRGVGTLALECNYCPHLELASNRPDYLKQRIMGGSGHLSNEQSARLARDIAPARRVVLLHLSRQCNTPDRAAAAHAGAPYELHIAQPGAPTPILPLGTAASLPPASVYA